MLCLVIQLCLTLCNPIDCCPPGSRQEHWSGLPSFLQGIFPTQGSNLGLLHCRWILYQLSYQGSPRKLLKTNGTCQLHPERNF